MTISIELALHWPTIGAVLFALLMFGLFFNGHVARLGEQKQGYTGLLVAAGVAVTLAGLALVWWQAALAALIAFIPSGVPMIAGDISRHIRAREQALEAMRKEAGRE